MYQDQSSSGLMIGFILGAAAGVAIGLLLAPKPGSETRELVRQGVTGGLDRVKEFREENR